jgi:hypothetical protein
MLRHPRSEVSELALNRARFSPAVASSKQGRRRRTVSAQKQFAAFLQT